MSCICLKWDFDYVPEITLHYVQCLCMSSIPQKLKSTFKKSWASKLDGSMPLRQSPIANPASLNSRSRTFDVATTKRVSKYFDVVDWVNKSCRLRSLSAKNNSVFCYGGKSVWSNFSRFFTDFLSIGDKCASCPTWR